MNALYMAKLSKLTLDDEHTESRSHWHRHWQSHHQCGPSVEVPQASHGDLLPAPAVQPPTWSGRSQSPGTEGSGLT